MKFSRSAHGIPSIYIYTCRARIKNSFVGGQGSLCSCRSVSGRVLDVFATPHPPSSWLIMKLGPYMKKIMRNPIPGSKTTQDVNFDDFFKSYFLKKLTKTYFGHNSTPLSRIGPILCQHKTMAHGYILAQARPHRA